ncbi:hypothetical protein [Terrisporobacter sp.]|uniref:hypothetical protein n=1 Tax=Terrisporobacter sp. TaxID=1965305 RepID=UPI002630CAC5|nr:hypothetical protein [Terrisporobacter sp.]
MIVNKNTISKVLKIHKDAYDYINDCLKRALNKSDKYTLIDLNCLKEDFDKEEDFYDWLFNYLYDELINAGYKFNIIFSSGNYKTLKIFL